MHKLSTLLRQQLKDAKRVAVLGIGSELRADDVAGILVVRRIKKLKRGKTAGPKLRVFAGGTAPENLTGEIRRFKPTHIVIIDAADLGEKAGKVAVLRPEDASGISFCTHSLPINVMTNYLHESVACQTMLIGIQPKHLTVGASPSREVMKAVESVAAAMADFFR